MRKYRHKLAVALAAMGLITFDMSDVRAQRATDISYYVTNTRTVLKNARALIEPMLTQREREIARSIDYRVLANENNNAFATWDGDQRVIIINAGMIQTFEWIADAMNMEYGLGLHGCFPAYLEYLAKGIIENSEAMASKLPPSLVFSAGLYASRVPGPCQSFNQAELAGRTDLGRTKAGMIEESIMFLYLHELGHHELGHVKPHPSSPTDLAMQRGQEDAADRWAILTALKAGYVLSGAAPWMMFCAELGGNSIEAEQLSDHPMGLRRNLTLLNETLTWLQNHRADWKGNDQSYRNAVQGLQNSIGYIASAMENMP